jgi:hypothetical protein
MSASPHGKCKAFIFGNSITINVPLLSSLNITAIQGELMLIKHNHLKIFFYVPETTAETRKRIEKEKNWLHSFADRLNLKEMSVYNTIVYDNNAGVVPTHLHHTYKVLTQNQFLYFGYMRYAKV